ncbi:MAG: hypothetical protein HRU38_15760 [Saccharospirillaceae bacterium]|nr:hypothetical protein [Pseudomonadales bacterium]NRB80097.1 hypothetical protein [Saccharospirillaceae bacterium]
MKEFMHTSKIKHNTLNAFGGVLFNNPNFNPQGFEVLQADCLNLYQEVMLHAALHNIPRIFKERNWIEHLPHIARFMALISDNQPNFSKSSHLKFEVDLLQNHWAKIGKPLTQVQGFFSSLSQLALLQNLDDSKTRFDQFSQSSQFLVDDILALKDANDSDQRFGVHIALNMWAQSSVWYNICAYLLMSKPSHIPKDFFVNVERCALKDQLGDWLVQRQCLTALKSSLTHAVHVLDAIEHFWHALMREPSYKQ